MSKKKELNLYDLFKINKPNITDNSINKYKQSLIKLNDNNNVFYNLDFLLKPETILNKIGNYKPSTIRNIISAICSLLNFYKDTNKKFIKPYEQYFILLKEYNNKSKEDIKDNDNDPNKWITEEEIKTKYDDLYKVIQYIGDNKTINKDTYNKLLQLIILSLYYKQPPRRNIDYSLMKVVKKYTNDLDNNFNYLDLKNKKFIFNVYKTANTYDKQVIDINEELYNNILFYLKYNKNQEGYLLSNYNNTPFNNGFSINRILTKIFNKNVGATQLRKIYLSSKYSNMQNELNKDVEAMGTSTDVAINTYIKK